MPGTSRRQRLRRTRNGASSRNGSGRQARSNLRRAQKATRRRSPILRRYSGWRPEGQVQPQGDPRYEAAVKNFALAARHFQKQNYEKAKELFEKLANNPLREVAERARVHLRL